MFNRWRGRDYDYRSDDYERPSRSRSYDYNRNRSDSDHYEPRSSPSSSHFEPSNTWHRRAYDDRGSDDYDRWSRSSYNDVERRRYDDYEAGSRYTDYRSERPRRRYDDEYDRRDDGYARSSRSPYDNTRQRDSSDAWSQRDELPTRQRGENSRTNEHNRSSPSPHNDLYLHNAPHPQSKRRYDRPSPRKRRRLSPISTKTNLKLEPTAEYIAASLSQSQTIEDPLQVRKLLVLDLNGTLLYRAPHKPFPRGEHPYANPYKPRPLRQVHPRPYLPAFRAYIAHPKTREWLDVAVWSSAQPHSVKDMVGRAFGGPVYGERTAKGDHGAKGEEGVEDGAEDVYEDATKHLVAVWARDTLGLSVEAYRAFSTLPFRTMTEFRTYTLQTRKLKPRKTSRAFGRP